MKRLFKKLSLICVTPIAIALLLVMAFGFFLFGLSVVTFNYAESAFKNSPINRR